MHHSHSAQVQLSSEGKMARRQAMKIVYDPGVDILRISFSSVKIAETAQPHPGMIFDYDEDGHIVGMEIIDASKRTDNPYSVEYTVAPSSP